MSVESQVFDSLQSFTKIVDMKHQVGERASHYREDTNYLSDLKF